MFTCDCPPDDCAGTLAKFLAGHREAGDILVRKYTPLVARIVQRCLGPARRGEWDDARQTVFLVLLQKAHTWQGRCPFCKWLAVVAARRAIDFRRIPVPVSLPDTEHLPAPAPPDPTLKDIVNCIEGKIADMEPRQANAVLLWRDGHGQQEIADQLGVSVRTIKYWLAAARERLKDCLDQ